MIFNYEKDNMIKIKESEIYKFMIDQYIVNNKIIIIKNIFINNKNK